MIFLVLVPTEIQMLAVKRPRLTLPCYLLQLLGKDLVVWRNNEGRWSCFDDRCPHRAAPLMEGKVEKDGTLM